MGPWDTAGHFPLFGRGGLHFFFTIEGWTYLAFISGMQPQKYNFKILILRKSSSLLQINMRECFLRKQFKVLKSLLGSVFPLLILKERISIILFLEAGPQLDKGFSQATTLFFQKKRAFKLLQLMKITFRNK